LEFIKKIIFPAVTLRTLREGEVEGQERDKEGKEGGKNHIQQIVTTKIRIL
jgi:hypothetical protein